MRRPASEGTCVEVGAWRSASMFSYPRRPGPLNRPRGQEQASFSLVSAVCVAPPAACVVLPRVEALPAAPALLLARRRRLPLVGCVALALVDGAAEVDRPRRWPTSVASIKPSSMASMPVARCLLRAVCTCAHTHAKGEHRGENAACRLRFLSRRLLLFLGMWSSVCAESLVSRSPRMKGIVKGLSRAPLVARWPAEYSSLMSVARLELHCRWGSVGGKDAAAQGSMAGGAQARALACGAAGMPDGGRAPVAGRIDAQRRPEEASAGVSCLPRPSDIFETRADFFLWCESVCNGS